MRTSKDLALAVNAGWVPFRLALMSLGHSGLDARTPAGWTYTDLAAHTAAWEDLAARRLAEMRASGGTVFPKSGVDADEFNARVVARTKGRDSRDILRELDDAHRALVVEIEKLPDDYLARNDSWVNAVVAGNSYGHYAEHHTELFSAVPKRPIGIRFIRLAFSAGSLNSHSINSGVSMGPGQIALDRMPLGPNCTARDFVSASTAPLEAV